MQFATASDYLTAYEADHTLAIVPIPLVAEFREVSPPAVTAMVRDGRVDGIRIGKNNYVLLRSLIAFRDARNKQTTIVEQFLIDLARKGQRKVFYQPVMSRIGLLSKVPADRKRIGSILGSISKSSHAEHGVLLSVLVHDKKAGATKPGKGFFELARDLHYVWSDDDTFVAEQTDLVLAAFRDRE